MRGCGAVRGAVQNAKPRVKTCSAMGRGGAKRERLAGGAVHGRGKARAGGAAYANSAARENEAQLARTARCNGARLGLTRMAGARRERLAKRARTRARGEEMHGK